MPPSTSLSCVITAFFLTSCPVSLPICSTPLWADSCSCNSVRLHSASLCISWYQFRACVLCTFRRFARIRLYTDSVFCLYLMTWVIVFLFFLSPLPKISKSGTCFIHIIVNVAINLFLSLVSATTSRTEAPTKLTTRRAGVGRHSLKAFLIGPIGLRYIFLKYTVSTLGAILTKMFWV